MPTATKLIGGIAMGLTAVVAAYYFMLEQGDYRIGPNFVIGNFPVGFFVGWYSLGRDPGHGNLAAAANGIRTLVLLVIASALLFSLIFIFNNLRLFRFRELSDFPLLWIKTSFEYAVQAMSFNVALSLLIGGCLSGIVAYQAGRRWT